MKIIILSFPTFRALIPNSTLNPSLFLLQPHNDSQSVIAHEYVCTKNKRCTCLVHLLNNACTQSCTYYIDILLELFQKHHPINCSFSVASLKFPHPVWNKSFSVRGVCQLMPAPQWIELTGAEATFVKPVSYCGSHPSASWETLLRQSRHHLSLFSLFRFDFTSLQPCAPEREILHFLSSLSMIMYAKIHSSGNHIYFVCKVELLGIAFGI